MIFEKLTLCLLLRFSLSKYSVLSKKIQLPDAQVISALSKDDIDFDREHLWHPYTSLNDPLKVYPVESANGTKIRLSDGRELLDGMSSWWCVIHGYNHPVLNKAAKDQLDKMSHVMFGGLTHAPAIELGKILVALTPEGLNKVFLCDSGSVSVEVSMKMAIQYQHALGNTHRSIFLTLRKGYHGDTSGAMSVCDPVSGMHHLFSDFMPKHAFMEAPQKGFEESLTPQDIQEIELFFEKNAANAVAFILEPVVQGAGGMRFYSPDYLRHIKRLCEQYKLLLIADEIATGFGRTGKMFACEHANICPDILCVGKALTGGYMTLAATICTDEVAQTICKGEAGVMMHGPTFMGNPLACAVAAASLDLLCKSPWQQRIKNIESILKRELMQTALPKMLKDVRVLGAIAVIETLQAVNVQKAQQFFVQQGLWLRPFRNLIYIMPPYIINETELIRLCEGMLMSVQMEEIFG